MKIKDKLEISVIADLINELNKLEFNKHITWYVYSNDRTGFLFKKQIKHEYDYLVTQTKLVASYTEENQKIIDECNTIELHIEEYWHQYLVQCVRENLSNVEQDTHHAVGEVITDYLYYGDEVPPLNYFLDSLVIAFNSILKEY
jgi:hypothetical protein